MLGTDLANYAKKFFMMVSIIVVIVVKFSMPWYVSFHYHWEEVRVNVNWTASVKKGLSSWDGILGSPSDTEVRESSPFPAITTDTLSSPRSILICFDRTGSITISRGMEGGPLEGPQDLSQHRHFAKVAYQHSQEDGWMPGLRGYVHQRAPDLRWEILYREPFDILCSGRTPNT